MFEKTEIEVVSFNTIDSISLGGGAPGGAPGGATGGGIGGLPMPGAPVTSGA